MPDVPDDPIVSVDWLAARLGAPDVRIVDATWFMPNDPRNARALYLEGRIPGANFFDIDEISDLSDPLPHMVPPPEKFASRVMKMGIGDGTRVVVYDALGLFSAARVWWLFRLMGKEDVVVLDGGLPAWVAAGHAVDTGPPLKPQERHFTPRRRADLIRTLPEMRAVLDRGGQIADARPEGRFTGAVPEPRPGLRPGHMPGAVNLPFGHLLTSAGQMKNKDELRSVLTSAGLDLARPIVCTCGSGISAAVLALGLAHLGLWNAAVYDGSWAEWGSRDDTPIVTGS